MHTYHSFYFTHLHVSVPLDHLQGVFVTEYIVSKCTGPIYKYVLWYGVRAEYMICVKNVKIHIS